MNSKQAGIIIVVILGVLSLASVVAITMLTALHDSVPVTLGIVLSTSAGGLLAILNPHPSTSSADSVLQGEDPAQQIVNPL